MNHLYKVLVFSLFTIQVSFAQPSIIPRPVQVNMPVSGGSLEIAAGATVVFTNDTLQQSAAYLQEYLKEVLQVNIVVEKGAGEGRVLLSIEPEKGAPAGAYTLHVDGKGVSITGRDKEGVFYGIQTLIQLLPVQQSTVLRVPFTDVYDYPRFQYRGMHLDVTRHFFPVAFVKKYIDNLARHKMNYFHWHLTDDQGWRIEIKKYPLLTTKGGYRNGTIIGHFPGTANTNTYYGGYYTQEEIKEVVAYAASRYITIIPEIEMPGHASAAIAAYPQLSCFPDSATYMRPPVSTLNKALPVKKVQETWGVFSDVFCPREYTFQFLQDVLEEVMALFPARYIHIGGDECPKDAWKQSAFCQQLIQEKGLKDEHGLQSYFVQRIEKYVNSKGRSIIGWDEILEGGLAPNAVVMSWRGEEGGIEAAKQNHDVIMTPAGFAYFDYSQALSKEKEDSVTIGCCLPLQKVYSYEPVPTALQHTQQEQFVLGAQANMWSEYLHYPSSVMYQALPRLAALCEVLWSKKELRDWDDFSSRLQYQQKRYELWKLNYNKGYAQ